FRPPTLELMSFKTLRSGDAARTGTFGGSLTAREHRPAPTRGVTWRGQSWREQKTEVQQEVCSLEKGTYVVDICTGRRGSVLGTTSTHCKVRFEPSESTQTGVKLQLGQDGQSAAIGELTTQILLFSRVKLWTPSWDGALKAATARSHCPQICLSSTNPSYSRAAKLEVAEVPETKLPALLACTASTHSLRAPRGRPRKRLLPLRLRKDFSTVSFSPPRSDDVEEVYAPRSVLITNGSILPTNQDEAELTLYQFKSAARARYGGSLVAAWKFALDTRCTGRVTFTDLVRGGRHLQFSGNYVLLWQQLTKYMALGERSAYITLQALDEEASDTLDEVRDFFEREDVTLEDLWERYLDTDGSGRCPYDDFMGAMTRLGFRAQKAKNVFRMLDFGGEQDVTMDELELIGLPRRPIASEVQIINHREQGLQRDKEAKQRVLSDFTSFLARSYGSVVRAWRQGLDSDGDGKLRFTEFCASCKTIGFRGKLKTLWRALDNTGTGFVSLGQLDREAETLLDEFRAFLEENYRTLDDVWERVLDKDRSGKCTEADFIAACKKLRWPGNALRIFKWLDLQGRDLSVEDCEFLGMRRRIESCPSAKQRILERQAKDRAEAEATLGRFRGFLAGRYGNLVRAWRKDLDPDGDGKLQFTEFCQACREMNFQGNLKALWLSLDKDDTGDISLEELDPEAVAHLEDFDRILTCFFTDLDTVWFTCLDLGHTGRCSLEEFLFGCKVLGFARNSMNLFRYLDIRNDSYICIEQLEVLSLPRAVSKEDAFQCAKETGARCRARWEQSLKVAFGGGLIHGWRRGFCSSKRENHLFEELSAEDFCRRCRSLGVKANLLHLWAELLGKSEEEEKVFLQEMCAARIGRRRSSLAGSTNIASMMSAVVPGGGLGRMSLLPTAAASIVTHPRDNGDRQLKLLGKLSLAHVIQELHQELFNFRKFAEQKLVFFLG
ncbi:unnamed protein product, partial [Polarella glacialis]